MGCPPPSCTPLCRMGRMGRGSGEQHTRPRGDRGRLVQGGVWVWRGWRGRGYRVRRVRCACWTCRATTEYRERRQCGQRGNCGRRDDTNPPMFAQIVFVGVGADVCPGGGHSDDRRGRAFVHLCSTAANPVRIVVIVFTGIGDVPDGDDDDNSGIAPYHDLPSHDAVRCTSCPTPSSRPPHPQKGKGTRTDTRERRRHMRREGWRTGKKVGRGCSETGVGDWCRA